MGGFCLCPQVAELGCSAGLPGDTLHREAEPTGGDQQCSLCPPSRWPARSPLASCYPDAPDGPASLYLSGFGSVDDDPPRPGTETSPTASAPHQARVMVARAPATPYGADTSPAPAALPRWAPWVSAAGRADNPSVAVGPTGPSGTPLRRDLAGGLPRRCLPTRRHDLSSARLEPSWSAGHVHWPEWKGLSLEHHCRQRGSHHRLFPRCSGRLCPFRWSRSGLRAPQ